MAPGARRAVALGLLGAVIAIATTAEAQAPTGTVRIALLPQWAIQQHRATGSTPSAELRQAVDAGVVDRTVFAWQRGVIQRQALVTKPIRVVPEPEAVALGGHGRFDLAAIRPPTGRSAWTEVEVTGSAPGADGVLVLEIGGERNTVSQVLETLLVVDPARGLVPLPLARPALIPGAGVPVVAARFEQPLPSGMGARFREEVGLGLLVARSPLWDIRNGDTAASGPADTVPLGGGDWREGDRVFVRIPAATLALGTAALALGWKDRTLRPDPDAEFPRRSSLPVPVIR